MGRASIIFQISIVGLFAALLFSLPAPYLVSGKTTSAVLIVIAFLALAIGLKLLSVFANAWMDQRSVGDVMPWLTLIIAGTTFSLSYFQFASSHWWLVIIHFMIVFCLFVLAWCIEARFLKFSSIVCLILTVCVLAGMEQVLDGIPAKNLVRSVRSMPLLAVPDRSFAFYEDHRFRGEYPCTDCEKSALRVFTMGGSATYGTPMHAGNQTFAAHFERMLSEKRKGEKFEVYNAGIPGHGITQIYNVLREKIIELKPDIVAINCWFNDSSDGTGWYGIPGKSDWEAYKQNYPLWKLQELSLFQFFYDTRTAALFRHYLVGLKKMLLGTGMSKDDRSKGDVKKEQLVRMPPDQYREVLHEIVALGKKHNFLPVLMLEPVNRTAKKDMALKANRYYRVIERVAQENGLPLVSALDRLNEQEDAWLFYDFIHPNGDGHRLIAEAFYNELFVSTNEFAKDFLTKKGVDLSLPNLNSDIRYVYHPKRLKNSLSFVARAPYLKDTKRDLLIRVNNSEVMNMGPLMTEFREFELDVDRLGTKRPLGTLELVASPVTQHSESARIGTSDLYTPVHIKLMSAGKDVGWGVKIMVSGKRVDLNYRSYNVALLDAVTGEVKQVQRFDTYGYPEEALKLERFLEEAVSLRYSDEPPLLLVAVKTDGSENVDKDKLSKLFSKFGGSGKLPERFESFVFAGSPKLKEGQAAEKVGLVKLELEIGDEQLSYSKLIELKSNTADGATLERFQ